MSTPRLAYLLKKFPRTSETFILNELLGLEEQGMDLLVFSRRQPDDEPRHPELARLNAEIEYLPNVRHLDPWSVLFGGDKALRDELMAKLGGVIEDFGALGHERFPSLLAEAVHLRARTRELGIEHLHVHFGTDAAVVAHLVSQMGGATYSMTLHAKDIYRNTVDRAILDRLVGGSEYSVTVCDANVAHLHGLVGEEAKGRIRRLYNGIDLGAHGEQGLSRDVDHVLGVGRLVEKKGFDLLLAATQSLATSGRELRVTIVGEGEERSSLEADIATRGLGDRVKLVGALGQDGVRDLMARATCMALPCRVGDDGNRDALPTVLLEAQAAGLPCISTPVTGIPEILDGGEAGLLVPEDDAGALADALGTLLDDAALRTRLSEAGVSRARELFDLRKNTAVLHEWHQGALAS